MATATASTKVQVQVPGEVLERSIRRVRKDATTGMWIGWVSLNGKDTKVTRKPRAKVWTVA